MQLQQPLSGIRVLDFGRVLSAPYGTLMLADLGADVVKVEHPQKGDDTRSFGPPFVHDVSSYFLSINRGKRSITLDLKQPEDKETAILLAEKADVVVENFRPGVMETLGLGAGVLQEANPRLIYASLSGYGRDHLDPGYDLMMQGLSGIPSITGPVDGVPYKCGASIADLVAGLNLAQAILAALFHRERTGVGSIVDVSMMEGQLSLLTYHASAYLNAGVEPKRMGNGHPSIHPFQPYECADGFLNICVGNDRIFARLAKAMDAPEWSTDPRFATNPDRVAHREALDALLIPKFLSASRLVWKERLQEYGVPADIVASIPEALQAAQERGKIVSHAHPQEEDSRVYSLPLPYKIANFPQHAERRPPLLGEHSAEVVKEWLARDD